MTIKITFDNSCNQTTSPLLVLDNGEFIAEECYAVFDAAKEPLELVVSTATTELVQELWHNPKMTLINLPPYSSRASLEALANDERLENMLLAASYANKARIPVSSVWEMEVTAHLKAIIVEDTTHM